MSPSETFYWHDYETFGANPFRDRPVQFAGLRTDSDLNVIGEPLVIFARPANDFLPQPGACLVTGITPQQALEKGVPESEFIARIHEQLARPGTCGVGYNSIRFDDEITRHTLYRNFYDPYAREWQHGNSRWDIIDMVRAAYALRPDGIEWPMREDGTPSFRLENLTAANGIAHGAAHEALSDVEATIALARLVRERQPKLFDYALTNRGKNAALKLLDIENLRPVLHVSGMFGAARHNIALIVPLAVDLVSRNKIICYNLSADPTDLIQLPADALRERLYTPTDELPEGVDRLSLKSVHINRCPMLVTAKMADAATAARLGIDGEQCRAHLAKLREYRDRDPKAFIAKVQAIGKGRDFDEVTDPDRMLYSGGFFSTKDKGVMARIQAASPEALASETFLFEDERLPEMLFRYRARNFPDTLTPEEREQWEEYRFHRLTEPEGGANLCMEEYLATINRLREEPDRSPRDQELLQQLLDYGDDLLA